MSWWSHSTLCNSNKYSKLNHGALWPHRGRLLYLLPRAARPSHEVRASPSPSRQPMQHQNEHVYLYEHWRVMFTFWVLPTILSVNLACPSGKSSRPPMATPPTQALELDAITWHQSPRGQTLVSGFHIHRSIIGEGVFAFSLLSAVGVGAMLTPTHHCSGIWPGTKGLLAIWLPGSRVIRDGSIVVGSSPRRSLDSGKWFRVSVNVVLGRRLYGKLIRARVVRLTGRHCRWSVDVSRDECWSIGLMSRCWRVLCN